MDERADILWLMLQFFLRARAEGRNALADWIVSYVMRILEAEDRELWDRQAQR